MWNKSYKSLYNKIQTSEEMDQRILQNLRKELGARRRISQRKLVFRFGAVMMLCFIMVQGKPIYAAVEKAIQHFVNRLEFQNDGSDKVIVEMEGTYLKLNEKAKKEWCKMDSIGQISEMLGVDILESTQEYEASNSISYHPYVSKSGALNGVMLINYNYVMGDLKHIQLETYSEVDINSKLKCDFGEKYQSPIGMQITIRSDDNEGVDYNDHELEYAGTHWNLREIEEISDIETVEIKNLEISVVLYTLYSPGPFDSFMENGHEIETLTVAKFMYEGIEYTYLGAVSKETMIEFLSTLH